jgi:hypothetical protein
MALAKGSWLQRLMVGALGVVRSQRKRKRNKGRKEAIPTTLNHNKAKKSELTNEREFDCEKCANYIFI